MSLDPDPLHVPDEPERRAKMRSLSCALQLAVILALALVGLLLVRQSASEATPRNAPNESAQSGVPHAAASQAGAGIETRPLQRPGGSGLGSADVSAEAWQARDLPRRQLVPELRGDASGGTPPPSPAGLSGLSVVPDASTPATLDGVASWYDAPGDVAAMPWYRWGMDPVWASVCAFADGTSRCVSVLVSDFCQCYVGTNRERVIDLSRSAFAQLADPSVGLIEVTVEMPQGPNVTIPPTDP